MSANQKIVFTEENDDGEEIVHELPAIWEICGACQGNGGSSAYLGAFTGEEFYGPDWDDDERERYLSGGYDRCCDDCGGTGKVLEVDEKQADPAIAARYEKQQSDRARWDAEDAYTRRMESGGYDG